MKKRVLYVVSTDSYVVLHVIFPFYTIMGPSVPLIQSRKKWKNPDFFFQNSGDPDSSQNENNNIDSFGSKRLRLDGEAESPLTPPSFKESNNKESLLSQALAEKPAIFMSNNGGGRSDGHDDSGASDTGSERPESMLDGSLKADSHMSSSFDIHR